MKAYRIIHISANIAAFLLLGVFLVYFLLSYGELPERIGVHFSPFDGRFDVYAEKLFGFYPFVAGFGLMLIFSLFTLPVKKIKKLGLNVDEKGETVLRCAAVLLLDLMKLMWAVFFSVWTHCVVHQISMGDGTFLDVFRVSFILILIATPILFSRIRERHSEGTPAERPIPELSRSSRVLHIVINAVSFGSLGAFLVYFLMSYESLPEHIGVHFGSDGGFDVYAAKVYGFYPFAAGFGLLLIFSLMSFAVGRIKRIGMNIDEAGEIKLRGFISQDIDILKLIWSMFFSVWAYCVINQTAMNTIFMSVLILGFLALFPINAVMFIYISKRYKIKQTDETQEKKHERT